MISKTFNLINQKLLIIIFVFCIVIVCFSFIVVYSNRIVFADVDKIEDIEIDSIMDTCEKYNIAAYYPATKNNLVNKKIVAFINSYIKRLDNDTKYFMPKSNDDKFNLLIEYEIARVNKDIVTFIFTINYSNNEDFNNVEIITLSYDLKFGKNITLDNFFEKNSDYTAALCDISKEYLLKNTEIQDEALQWFKDDISNSMQNSFDGYSFSNTHLSIYFNSNKIASKFNEIYEVKIPWENIKHLLKKNIYLLDEYDDIGKKVSMNYNNSNENNLYFPAFNINTSSDDKVIALTFDDGPHRIYTDRILKHLGKNNIVATFFVLGNRLDYNKELLVRMVDLGCEIGNHSLSHKQLTNISDKEIINQIESVNVSIKNITGYNIRAVRPPYGLSNAKVKRIIGKPIVLWNIDPEDWKNKNPIKVKQHVLSRVKSGSIILLHDIYGSSVDASIMIIDELLKQGYKFLTVSQMLQLQDESTNGITFTHKK